MYIMDVADTSTMHMYIYLPVVFISLYILTKHAFHKLQNLPPTPFPSLPIIGHLYLLKTNQPLHKTLSSLAARYGPVFHLHFGSRPVLVVSSATAAEECFTKNDIVFANRPHLLFAKYIGYNNTSIVWGPYGDNWRNLRRICSLEILSTNRLQKMSHIRNEEVKALVLHLFQTSACKNGETDQPLRSAFFSLMFNVLTRMVAGKTYYGEKAEKSEMAMRFKAISNETARLAAQTGMGDYVPILRWLLLNGLEKKFVALCKRRNEFMQELIEEFRGGGGGGCSGSSGRWDKSMIEILLELHEAEPDCFKDEDIRSLMLALIQAGVSTSVDTLEWAMSLLLNNPKTLHKAQIEIDNLVGHNRLINEDDVVKLPYLRCIIDETLRMHPVVPFLIPHESSRKCVVGGYTIPRGTMLLVNLKAIQNDPKFWIEPENFRPERFEGVGAGFNWMPFGLGRRSCPGEGLALRVDVLALGALIQCFDWARVGKQMVEMTESDGLFGPKVVPLRANYKARPSMVKLLSQI